jgi:hypothetical protein
MYAALLCSSFPLHISSNFGGEKTEKQNYISLDKYKKPIYKENKKSLLVVMRSNIRILATVPETFLKQLTTERSLASYSAEIRYVSWDAEWATSFMRAASL